MTDKSFGDNTNRNTVKNPLLSSAVTGLSIQDLTHHAVLLPVSRSQEVITRPDQQIGTQTVTLEHTDHVAPNYPSGDANANQTHPTQPKTINPTSLGSNQTIKTESPFEKPCSTQSKVSVKSEDDFDVNEYFARLQGTRYVSAPLNSCLKEDQNANLEATEENLEEINLNEPDKFQTDVQQSLTADIAQNFSQLPTVLPQVASAVFSSFSNMLSMKSREQTPDEIKPGGYQEMQYQRAEATVPSMGVPEVKEMGPPPKEPPIVGTSNYRLPIKKKYAQIPGLSSGDTTQIPVYNPISHPNMTSYFVPSHPPMNPHVTEAKSLHEVAKTPQGIANTVDNVDNRKSDEAHVKLLPDFNSQAAHHTYNIFNPTEHVQSIPQETKTPDQINAADVKKESDIFVHSEPDMNIISQSSQFYKPPSQDISMPAASNAAIIPPPPMFSNLPRRDSQIDVGKSILPPSVARRISSNQPIMKTQAASVSGFSQNIFVPTPISDISDISNVNVNLSASLFSTEKPTSAFAPFSTPAASTMQNTPIFASASIPLSSEVPLSASNTRLLPSTLPFSQQPAASNAMPLPESNLPPQTASKLPPPPTFASFSPSSNFSQNIPPFQVSAMSASATSKPIIQTAAPAIFTPTAFPQSQSETNIPSPPRLFSATTMPPKVTDTKPNVPLSIPQFVATNTAPVESAKPMTEPPKASGNLSYRMTKKRPQYYSGPIEGVGAISNNVKPVFQPPVQASVFHGALFIPAQQMQEAVEQNLTAPNIDHATVPFDISRPAEVNSPYASYNFNQPKEQTYTQPEFSTAFDFSRQTTENIEPPKEESKGFGIIGSLKSKLSSLDINKLQNTVTTFFDPAYNDTRKDVSSNQESVPYGHTYPASSYGQHLQNPTSNFEIFVPNVSQTEQYNQTYGYQMPSRNQNPVFAQTEENPQYYQQQHQYNYYQNQGQHDLAPSYQNLQPNIYDISVPESYSLHTQSTNQGNVQGETKVSSITNVQLDENVHKLHAPNQEKIQKVALNDTVQTEAQNIMMPEVGTSALNFFDISQPLQDEYFGSKITDSQINQDVTSPANKSEITQENLFRHFKEEKPQDLLLQDQKQNNKPVQSERTVSALDVSSVALLGLTTMLADKSQELTNLENDLKNITLKETPKNLDTIFSQGSDADFFDDMNLENKSTNYYDKNDLALCEVSEPEDINADTLTIKLIENITSPIQLSNPVVVPLTEHNTPVENRVDIDSNFDSNQCAEISHITEETIETIQVQSATELLEANQLDDPNIRSYGWCADDKSFAAAKVLAQQDFNMKNPNPSIDHDYMSPNSVLDHNYSLQMKQNSGNDHCYSLPNPSSIGFFANNNLFADNIPTNASDEIKAEFKSTHDEPPVILLRQLSIPSAPPAEDDSQLDESGIDVHSIEADAKKDFPFLEEYAVEPSETDDEKIDYKVRDRSVEPVQEDSFTNRVERFKKMETTDPFDLQKNYPYNLRTATSPSVPIASYFDTGNYAADTHYKNSLTSSNMSLFNIGSSNAQLRIPPGFEEEFQKRLSGLSSQANASGNNIPFSIPYIPDTSTQTRPTFSPTFCSAQTSQNIAVGSTVISRTSEYLQANESSPIELDALPDIDKIIGDDTGTPVSREILTGFTNPIFAFNKGVLEKSQDLSQNTSNETRDFTNIFAVTKESIHEDVLESSPYNPTIKSQEEFSTKSQNEDPTLPSFFNILCKEEVTKSQNEDPTLPSFFNILGAKEEVTKSNPETPHILAKSVTAAANDPEKPQSTRIAPSLPDHINFFSSNLGSGSSQKTEADDSTFNRLASYFGSPVKTDNTKSFFELSQGQDHYRLDSKLKDHTAASNLGSGDIKESNVKTFFVNQNASIDTKIQNIPQDKYIANLNLMRDLTSIQNVEVNPDQVVRTVKYFTVEYNNEHLDFPSEYNIGEPENVKMDDSKKDKNKPNETEETCDDETAIKLINTCKCCCNMNSGYIQNIDVYHEGIGTQEFRVKRNMDSNSEAKKEIDNTMEQASDCAKSNSVSVEFNSDHEDQNSNETSIQMSENRSTSEYTPVKHHWFYRVDVEGKSIWRGFSIIDSKALEDAYHSHLDENTLVPTDGGRFDVNVVGRLKVAVYWADKPVNVRRCSWFYKGTTDARYVPYTESVAEKLEVEYRHGVTTGEWHRRLVLPNNELVVMHGPTVMVHFLQSGNMDAFNSTPLLTSAFGKRVYRNPPKIRVARDQPERVDHLVMLVHGAGEYRHQREKQLFQSTIRPRVVRRGHEETEIEDIEPSRIDHLLLMCHGVGSTCDMRFRSVEEVVEDFRTTSLQLLQSHYKNSYDSGVVGRVEVLPISWHSTLHSGETGVDRRLARITLDSIPRLRAFTNDTVLDVLFYTSPVFCQTIIDTVCTELNRIYKLFRERNPDFTGEVSVGGHSLGSVILYDLLCHQTPAMPPSTSDKRYVNGAAGTGQPTVKYPKLHFAPVALYALGSPIAIFECIRGVESLGLDFKLPTCKNFFNVFHPYDPIAYRIEPLINAQMRDVKPFLIPHHKGRKRMHLELKDTMARVGADIKQKLIESIKSTWSNMWKTQPPPTDRQLEKVVEEEMEKEQLTEESIRDEGTDSSEPVVSPTAAMLGRLNNGRRIDYVLQEAPFEMINEYIFAMSSHVCYWESEDTMLMMLREIYDSLGVQPDCTVPQQSLTVQRARAAGNDERININVSEHPSTSRDGT